MSWFGDVVAYLDAREVPTAVIGAAALAFHGVARTTLDTDLLTIDRRVRTSDFWSEYSNEVDVRRGDFTDPLAAWCGFVAQAGTWISWSASTRSTRT